MVPTGRMEGPKNQKRKSRNEFMINCPSCLVFYVLHQPAVAGNRLQARNASVAYYSRKGNYLQSLNVGHNSRYLSQRALVQAALAMQSSLHGLTKEFPPSSPLRLHVQWL